MSEKKSSQRFHSLNTEQVEVLHQVLSEVVPIHGRGNFPTLELRPRDIIIAVRAKLQKQGITVRDVRLNGSTASHVLVRDNGTSYKDLDIIFGVDLPSQEEFQVIKESVLGCLLDCLPAGVNRERISSATMKEAYVQKMVKVFNEHDRWSLISLSNNSGKNLELKFVSALRRQFEFSVDSFQIILDRLLESYMQQDSQHKVNTVNLKDQPGDADSNSLKPSQTAALKTEKSGAQPSDEGMTWMQQREEVHEKESQTEFSLPAESLAQMEKVDTSAGNLEEHSESFNEKEQTSLKVCSEKKEAPMESQSPSQTEVRHNSELLNKPAEPLKEINDDQQLASSNHKEFHVQKEPANHTEPCNEKRKLTEQIGHSDMPNASKISQAECPNLREEQPDKANFSEHFIEDQRSNEADKAQHVSALPTSTSSCAKMETQQEDEREAEMETRQEIEAESKTDMEMCDITEEISALEEKHAEDTQSIDCSRSTTSTVELSNTQPADTDGPPETHSSDLTDDSEKAAETPDAVSPPNTQDIFNAPPGLVSDTKNTSSPSAKVSDRLSHMVVLKHSSPKPPRRMCRKVTTNPHPNRTSDVEFADEACPEAKPCPSSESNSISNLKPTIAYPDSANNTTTFSFTANSEVELDLSSISSLNPDLNSALLHALPQESSSSAMKMEGLCEESLEDTPNNSADVDVQCLSCTKITVSEPNQSDPLNSADTEFPHNNAVNSVGRESVHTSDDGQAGGEQTTKTESNQTNGITPNPVLNSALSSHSVVPPLLSLSPPHFTPSPPSLSPPPCLTPPSPMLSTMSPTTSFSSPPQSFSPTSSCLSSPPYLTPPMLSLSPPPLCPTPPSPCLSPPLLCFTPPVEFGDLLPQESSDMESFILNADVDDQNKLSSAQSTLESEDEKRHDYVSALPQVTEPVSFPITIPSSSPHVLSHQETGGLEVPTPPEATEILSTVHDNKEDSTATTSISELSGTLAASDSVPAVEVLAESMYGDFEAAMDHLRYRLIATRNPEEIRGGGLLKYSNLLVRDYRPASETQIKTLERYMCSRFFIDFPDVQEQQRKILSYLKNHFIGEERSKYQYLMTLRRVIDDSTVCLMGHERRQTLNMITVLALKVLGEQNIIPNTDHVTCFYQPAPYLAEHTAPYLPEPSYCSYYIPQGPSTLLYQPYPLHLHPQTGLV